MASDDNTINGLATTQKTEGNGAAQPEKGNGPLDLAGLVLGQMSVEEVPAGPPDHPGDQQPQRDQPQPATGDEIISDDAEIARLAKLKPLVFEREAKAAADRLGCRVTLLRKLVALERGDGKGSNNGQGKPLELPELEPWDEPVDGGELLDALVAAIRRYVVIGQAAARVTALWVVAAYCFACFLVFPRLFITAAEMQCGKTTLLDVLSLLTPRPLAVSNISPAALFRTIAAVQPTLLLDEFDGYTKDTAEELRQIIDAGHKRGGAVIRTVGDSHEPRLFDAYSPMVIAAIGAIAGTLMNRSIVIRLRRRLASETIASLRLDRAPELLNLARQIARWAADHGAAVAQADPAMAGLANRTADNWRPLFAVAELAGNGWGDLAHDAAVSLLGDEADEASVRVRLLFDIRERFVAQKTDRLSSDALVDYLNSLEDRPWPEWGKAQKPITKVQVSRLLKPLEISPKTIRLPNGTTPKGYYQAAFEDAFARLLPPYVPPAEVSS
jgi:putative DNA primase/helicase